MIRTIHLHGALADRYGASYRLAVDTPREAARALAAQLRGFRQDIAGGRFRVVRGADIERGRDLGEDEVTLGLGRARDLHIMPVVAGAGGSSRGIIKVVVGVALIGIGIAGALGAFGAAAAGFSSAAFGSGLGIGITYTNIVMTGLALTLGGVSVLLAPQPNLQSSEPADRRPSFLFNGPVNRTEAGNVVPLVYGRVIAGSVTVSAGMTVEKYAEPPGTGNKPGWTFA